MRRVVSDLVALGPMPDENAEADTIDAWSDLLDSIQDPLSNEEAAALARCFPPDLG